MLFLYYVKNLGKQLEVFQHLSNFFGYFATF